MQLTIRNPNTKYTDPQHSIQNARKESMKHRKREKESTTAYLQANGKGIWTIKIEGKHRGQQWRSYNPKQTINKKKGGFKRGNQEKYHTCNRWMKKLKRQN